MKASETNRLRQSVQREQLSQSSQPSASKPGTYFPKISETRALGASSSNDSQRKSKGSSLLNKRDDYPFGEDSTDAEQKILKSTSPPVFKDELNQQNVHGLSAKKPDNRLENVQVQKELGIEEEGEDLDLFSSRRLSQTHNILKSAGLSYDRGQPVFPKARKNFAQNEPRVDYVHQPSLKRLLKPQSDRRGAASAIDFVKRSEADVHEQKRKIGGAWWDSSSLRALDLDQQHKEGLERGEISLVLPYLCKSRSSLTRSVSASPELGIKSISESSILVDTSKGQQVVIKSTVKLNAEAMDILRHIENLFAERFCIDMRKYNIPVRLVGEAALLQAALEQKSRRNAHLLCTPVRALAIKKEIKLPTLQGRLMHSTMQKTVYSEPQSFDRLEFDYKRKPGMTSEGLAASSARSRRTVFRLLPYLRCSEEL